GHHAVVDTQLEECLEVRDHGAALHLVRDVVSRIAHPDKLDTIELREDAAVVTAHHAKAKNSSAKRHHAPAFATAFTASTIWSRSASVRPGYTGRDSTSSATFSVTGRSSSRPKLGRRWIGVG